MLKKLYPDLYVDSTYHIDFASFYKRGYRGVLFDVDNTLVPHGAPADERAIAFFAHLKEMGFRTCMISNNKEPRVKMFCDAVGADYIYKAGKPLPKGYQAGMKKIGCSNADTIFVGDQIFTDVLGSKRAGIFTILVEPIDPKEEIQIVLKRYLEKIVLFFYKKQLKK